MSLKTDLIVVGVAGVVLLAAAWYAKKKVGAAADSFMTGTEDFVNGTINAAGQWITGDNGWTHWGGHSPQYNYEIPENFGIIDPSTWD